VNRDGKRKWFKRSCQQLPSFATTTRGITQKIWPPGGTCTRSAGCKKEESVLFH